MKLSTQAEPKSPRRLGFGQVVQMTIFLAIAATVGSGQSPIVAPKSEQPTAAPHWGSGVMQAGSVSPSPIGAADAAKLAPNAEKAVITVVSVPRVRCSDFPVLMLREVRQLR